MDDAITKHSYQIKLNLWELLTIIVIIVKTNALCYSNILRN